MSAATTLKDRLSFPAVSGGVFPSSINGSNNSGTVDMSKFYRVAFLVQCTTTLNAYIKQSANANGAGASNIAAVTSGTNTLAMTANTQATLELRADQMTSRYALCQVVIDTAGVTGIVPIAGDPRFGPANASDNTTFMPAANRLVLA